MTYIETDHAEACGDGFPRQRKPYITHADNDGVNRAIHWPPNHACHHTVIAPRDQALRQIGEKGKRLQWISGDGRRQWVVNQEPRGDTAA